MYFNSFPARGDLFGLLITFANSLDPDQARQNVGPDLDPNCLTLMVFLKDCFLKKKKLKKKKKKKKKQTTKKACKITQHAKSYRRTKPTCRFDLKFVFTIHLDASTAI